MEDLKKYYGVIIFALVIVVLVFISMNVVKPKYDELKQVTDSVVAEETKLQGKKTQLITVQNKLKKLKDSITGSQKKIFSPIESDLGNDTLFFTLYNDVIEMVHANYIKIKAIDYKYNPESDEFVKFGKDVYFVCDINMELVSNYTNLGKLLENIQQYPYYIKINEINVKPYNKDKKILITNMSLRLYAHTSPEQDSSKLNIAM